MLNLFLGSSIAFAMVGSTSASRNRTSDHLLRNETLEVTGISTSAPPYEWEYYFDYLDPVFVDESQLKYHKYSIVIILWISLAAFVGLLFLILNLMSLGVKLPKIHKSKVREHHESSTV